MDEGLFYFMKYRLSFSDLDSGIEWTILKDFEDSTKVVFCPFDRNTGKLLPYEKIPDPLSKLALEIILLRNNIKERITIENQDLNKD